MPESKNKKPRRTFTADFKSQIVQLYQNGKRKSDIIKEYDILTLFEPFYKSNI